MASKLKDGTLATLVRIDEFTADEFCMTEQEYAEILEVQGGEVIIDGDATGDGMYFNVISVEKNLSIHAISEYHLKPYS